MEKLLIKKSEELLHDFFARLKEKEKKEVGLMGGWAVYHLLKSKNVAHMF